MVFDDQPEWKCGGYEGPGRTAGGNRRGKSREKSFGGHRTMRSPMLRKGETINPIWPKQAWLKEKEFFIIPNDDKCRAFSNEYLFSAHSKFFSLSKSTFPSEKNSYT